MEEASNNKPDKSETEVCTKDNQAVVILDDMIRVLHGDPTTEQCVDSSNQTKKVKHFLNNRRHSTWKSVSLNSSSAPTRPCMT